MPAEPLLAHSKRVRRRRLSHTKLMLLLMLVVALVGVLLLYHLLSSGSAAERPPETASALPLAIFHDHGVALDSWMTHCPAGRLSVLHIDKHDDLEVPENVAWVRKYKCRKHTRRNNDFIVAAAACDRVDRVAWIRGDFASSSGMREYEPAHRCRIGRLSAESACTQVFGERRTCKAGEYAFAPMDLVPSAGLQHGGGSGARCDPFPERGACASFGPCVTNASALQDTSEYEFAVMREAEAVRGASVLGSLGNVSEWLLGAEARPWILDVDLDYFVDDLHSPKTAALQKSALGELVGEVTSAAEVDALCEGFMELADAAGTSASVCCDLVFELMILPKVPRLNWQEVRHSMRQLRILLQGMPTPPCLVTVARSIVGLYTPLADALELEQRTLGLLEEVFGATRRLEPSPAFRMLHVPDSFYHTVLRRITRMRENTTAFRLEALRKAEERASSMDETSSKASTSCAAKHLRFAEVERRAMIRAAKSHQIARAANNQ